MLYDPPGETTIVIPTLNEEMYIQRAISSLKGQDIVKAAPNRFEFLVVDSGSSDGTKKIVESSQVLFYPGPVGKLSSRDLAFELADGDVVFSADADTYYPPNTLNLLLRHFQDKAVVAAYGPMMFESPPLLRLVSGIQYFWQSSHLYGGNNAIRREAYFDAGRFDLSVDQKNRRMMIEEEEGRMFERLLKVGDVMWERDAVALASSRRQTGGDQSYDEQRAKKLRFEVVG